MNGRTETVSVFAPGETIEVLINEDINHPAYYRVAFDDDGDDGFRARENMDSVVREGDDPAAENPVDGQTILAYIFEDTESSTYSAMVTLPNIECENCTLQVIQFMYDKLGDGMDNEYYHQCADIALRGDTSGAGGASSTGDASSTGVEASTSGVGGASTSGAGGVTGTTVGASTTAPAGATTGATGTSGMSIGGASSTSSGVGGASATTATSGVGGGGFVDPMTGEPASSDAGCGCRVVATPSAAKLMLLPLGLGLVWARRRRRSV
jgi:MYXO-CTERM domain-containing protein